MLSVIVPVYNEAKVLPASLAALLEQTGDYEVIVVDGGSTDRTREIVRSHPGIRLEVSAKGRAVQMNAGARVATGALLLFLHADTKLPESAIHRLNILEARNDCDAGAHRHRFAPDDWRLQAISHATNLRCRITHIFYGDQAMFVRPATFWQLGGFPEVPMLEDVMFCERLRRVTRPILLDECVVTDARRFVEHGVFRSVAYGLVILACHKLRLPVRGHGFSDEVR